MGGRGGRRCVGFTALQRRLRRDADCCVISHVADVKDSIVDSFVVSDQTSRELRRG